MIPLQFAMLPRYLLVLTELKSRETVPLDLSTQTSFVVTDMFPSKNLVS